ncbi:hypothetical protein BC829DRAFT_447287 [Chytridium lagenaria]|nr:hypothetical protein BC829DRAFT_447287 [Chytridium lagenaria]
MARHAVEEEDMEVVDVDGEEEEMDEGVDEPEEEEYIVEEEVEPEYGDDEDEEDEVIEVEDVEIEAGPVTAYIETEEEEQEEPEPFLLQDGDEENWIFPTPFDYTIQYRRRRTVHPVHHRIHRRDNPILPAETATMTPTSLPTLASSSQQPLITGPLISAGVAATAVIIAMAALVLNHRNKSTPQTTTQSNRPLSRSASRLESANVKLGNGPAAHASLVGAKPRPASTSINGTPVFMDRMSASPKVSPRTSVSYGSGSPVTRKLSTTGSTVGTGKAGSRVSVTARKEIVNEEEDDDDDSDSESDEEPVKEKALSEKSGAKEVRRSPTLTEDHKAEARNFLQALRQLKEDKTEAVKLIYKKTPQDIAEISKCVRGCEEDFAGLITQPHDYDAICLEEAMKGIGCDEDALIEILVGRSNAEVEGIKTAYKARYEKDLEKIVSSETTFISILTDRSDAHLRKMFTAYKLKYKDSMEEVVKKEFKGDMEKALLGIVRSIENRPRHVASLFEKAMKGVGHNHSKLIRLVVRHRNPDVMRQIKMEYLVEYDKLLFDRIKEGNDRVSTRNVCLSLWGNNWIPFYIHQEDALSTY